MKRLNSISLALSIVVVLFTAGCSDNPKPAANAKPANNNAADNKATDAKPADNATATDKGSADKESTEKSHAGDEEIVMLGSDELFTGIPGSPELTEAEIKAWIDDPKNNEPLKYELPLGIATGKGQEKGLQENPLTRAKIELGRQLYFDPRLSVDQSISCASCHAPGHGFARETQFGEGVKGQKGGRNSPVAYNRLLSDLQFWDGRASTLEEQAKGPIANPIEMSNTHESCVSCIEQIPGYKIQFEKIFAENGNPGKVNIDNIAKAIASFERALVTGPSPFDYQEALNRFKGIDPEDMDDVTKAKYEMVKAGAEKNPMSESAQRGMALFFGKANCTACHVGPNLTDEKFHNIGVGMDKEKPDVGRYEVTKDDKDWGAFKTPTIRNVAQSAPYMHDGSQKTLKEVVAWYNKGGEPNKNLSEKIKKLNLTDEEQADLVAFLEACSGPMPKVNETHKPKGA